MTSPREPTNDLFKFADFFTPNFYKAAKVSNMIYWQGQENAKSDLLLSLLDKNVSKKGKDERIQKIKGLLNDITLQTVIKDDKKLKTAKSALVKDYTKYDMAASSWIRKIFGFRLPDKLDVILDITPFFGQGMLISDNPPLVALSYPKYKTSNVSTLLHETLHYLIRKNGLRDKLLDSDPILEEALLDYFCPHGILDEKVGLLKHKLDLEKHHRQQVQQRPASKHLSDQLLPLLKEYYQICGTETIWEFLRRKNVLSS
ncbi:MAG: hypothetical protein QXY86_01485 [Candidatus Micrarchaeaceae archaeon]